MRRAVTAPTFVLLAGGALGGYFLPKYIANMDIITATLAGAAVGMLVVAII